MTIRLANTGDLPALSRLDHHAAPEEIARLAGQGRILVAEEQGALAGWLRWNLFWDNTPFMNLLYVLEPYRGRGVGRRLVEAWEHYAAQLGYPLVMTSTQADEYAQHFYVHLGYRAAGGFALPGDPYELIFAKELKQNDPEG